MLTSLMQTVVSRVVMIFMLSDDIDFVNFSEIDQMCERIVASIRNTIIPHKYILCWFALHDFVVIGAKSR